MSFYEATNLPVYRGNQVRVRGLSQTFIAQNDILSNPVFISDGKAYSKDVSRSRLKRTTEFYKSRSNIPPQESNINLATVWQEFYNAPSPIDFHIPRYIKGSDEYYDYFRTTPNGWTTLEEAIASRTPGGSSNSFSYTVFANSKTINDRLRLDPSNTLPESELITPANLATLRSAIANFADGFESWTGYLYNDGSYTGSSTYTYTAQYGNFDSNLGRYFAEETIEYTAPAFSGSASNQIYPGGGNNTIPSLVASDPNELDFPDTFNGFPLFDILVSGTVWRSLYSNNLFLKPSIKSVRWWLQLHSEDSSPTPIELLTCNYLERIRVFLTCLEDKTIFIAKIGYAQGWSNPDPPVVSVNPVYVKPPEFARIIIIEVDKQGNKTQSTYDYPNAPIADTENWQQWAYSFTDYGDEFIGTHEFSNDCGFQVSRNLRRINAAQKEFSHLSYDPDTEKDLEFESQTVDYSPPNDVNSGYFAAGQLNNYIIPVLSYSSNSADYVIAATNA